MTRWSLLRLSLVQFLKYLSHKIYTFKTTVNQLPSSIPMAASSYEPSVPQLTLQMERITYLQVHTGLPATFYSCSMDWELCHTVQRCFACKDQGHCPRGNYMAHKGFSSLLGNLSSLCEVRIYTSTIEYIASHTHHTIHFRVLGNTLTWTILSFLPSPLN